MIRIITGSAKGMKLKTLEGLDTRPTTGRTKEAIFSMIQFDIEGRDVLDLFAGSGQMGLEALSRGAASAVFVDNSAAAMAVIKENATHTRLYDRSKFRISDVRNFLRKAGALERRASLEDTKDGTGAFDLVFIDPPYDKGLLTDTLIKLAESGLLRPSAIIVCECSKDENPNGDPKIAALYDVVKINSYGSALISVLTPAKEEATGADAEQD